MKECPYDGITRGLCEGIVRNYLNNLAKGKRIEPRVVFQGGVAYNVGVKRAFEETLRLEVTVPLQAGIMGAIGMSLLTRDMLEREEKYTQFIGLDIHEMEFDARVFECNGCPNICEVVQVQREGKLIDRYGYRCDRWDILKTEEEGSPPSPPSKEKMIR